MIFPQKRLKGNLCQTCFEQFYIYYSREEDLFFFQYIGKNPENYGLVAFIDPSILKI
jgi:hypothetical protein